MSYQLYHGAMIPARFDHARAVDRFNRGEDHWCANAVCGDGLRCRLCILCDNISSKDLPPERKALLFARWAHEHNYSVFRPGLDALRSRNDSPFNDVEEVGL